MDLPQLHADRSSPDPLVNLLKENRKVIGESLRNVLAAAEYIFEHGHFSREEYYCVEDLLTESTRLASFLDVLAAKDIKVLEIFMDYLSQHEGDSGLVEKLRVSRDKVTRSLTGLVGDPNDNLLGGREKVSVDFNDFTLSHRGLEEVVKLVKKDERVIHQWDRVIPNMIGLESLDVFQLMDLMKCENWDEILLQSFTLWKERNGPNATFFSLVGIFQQSRLVRIADLILDKKEQIQKAPLRK